MSYELNRLVLAVNSFEHISFHSTDFKLTHDLCSEFTTSTLWFKGLQNRNVTLNGGRDLIFSNNTSDSLTGAVKTSLVPGGGTKYFK